MSNTYVVYAVFHTKNDSYISNEGYHYQMACLHRFEYDTVDEAKECINFLVSKGVFNAKDLVIHELTLSVSQVINVTHKEES